MQCIFSVFSKAKGPFFEGDKEYLSDFPLLDMADPGLVSEVRELLVPPPGKKQRYALDRPDMVYYSQDGQDKFVEKLLKGKVGYWNVYAIYSELGFGRKNQPSVVGRKSCNLYRRISEVDRLKRYSTELKNCVYNRNMLLKPHGMFN